MSSAKEQQLLETAMIGGALPGVMMNIDKIPMGQDVSQMTTGVARSQIDKYITGVLRIVTQNRKLNSSHSFSRMTVPRLLQMTALHFRSSEWRGLQTSIDMIPSLAAYVSCCKKTDNCIHAIFASRDILTLYELRIEVCLVLGVRNWEVLGTLHNIENNPCVIQYFGVQLPGPPPEIRSRDILSFSFSQTEDTNLGSMLKSFANAQQIDVEIPEHLGVWIRNLRTLIDLLDIEKRRVSTEITRQEIQKELQTESSTKLVKWLIGILNTKHSPSTVNPLLSVRSKHVRSVFSNPTTASAGHQHLVVSSIHKLLKPTLDETWVSDDDSTDTSSASSSSNSSSNQSSSSSSASSSSDGRARGKVKRRKKKASMLTRLEKKVDKQHQKLQRRAERRSQKQLGIEQMEIVQDFVKKRELRENYQNFGVATREMVVDTIKETLMKIPKTSWALSGTTTRIEQEIQDNFSAPVDVVCAKVGKYSEILLEAIVAVDTDSSKEASKKQTTGDVSDGKETALLPDSERVSEIATLVETAAENIRFDPIDVTNTTTIDYLYQLERRTISLISRAAGKELLHFSDCKLGSFLQFVKDNSATSSSGECLLSKTTQTLTAMQSCNSSLVQLASAFIDTASCNRNNPDHKRHIETSLMNHIIPANTLAMVGGTLPEALAPGSVIQTVVKQHINAKCCLDSSVLDTPEYNPHGINNDVLTSKIKQLPPLTEVTSALCWKQLLHRRFGSAEAFLTSQGIPFFTCGRIWNGEAEEIYILGEESDTTADHFKRAMNRGAGRAASAVLLGMFYLGNTSIELLAAYVESSLSNQATDTSKMIIIKDAVLALPGDIVKIFGRQVFLSPLQGQVQTAFSGMLRISSPDERRRLRELGCVLGVSLWKREYESWLLKQDSVNKLTSDYVTVPQPTTTTAPLTTNNQPDNVTTSATTVSQPTMTVGEKPSKPKDDSITTNTPYESIQSILRTEFGVGADLSDEGKLLHRTSSSRMGRAIERLASDLYSTDVHFVLELIQNADDNSYSDSIVPSLFFDLSPSAVIVSNNEIGFSERNMRALCDVGSSTKAQSEGYIGMKGIGFKSVFRVTTAPEIHSGGFHISFDLATGPMGYIQPKWIGEGTSEDDRIKLVKEQNCGTQVVLPLTAEMSTGDRRDVLLAKLDDIHPSLMLFVRKLRKVSITDHISGNIREMTRYDISDTIIDVQVNGTPCKWLVNKGQLIPEIRRGDSRGNLQATELALAFPMSQVEADAELEEMMVFAFLPLRPCGFKFVLQADWIIPSSREDIDAGSPWNQWLRSKVGTLFIDSLSHFKDYFPSDEPHRALSAFLSFIPHGNSIAGFFKPVIADIKTQLLQKECILTSLGTWTTPGAAVIIPDALCGEPCLLTEVVAPPNILKSDLQKYYLDPRVSIPTEIASHLQLETFGISHLITIIKQRVLSYTNSTEWCNWLSRWLISLQYCLDGRCGIPPTGSTKAAILRDICNLRIFPLSSGKLTSFKDGYIFFDIDEVSSTSTGQLTSGFASFLGSLRMLDSKLIAATSDGVAKELLRSVLHNIGIRQMTPPEVVASFVLPLYESIDPSTDIVSDDKAELLQATVLYVKDNMTKIGTAALQNLSKCIVLETSKGYARPHDVEILTTGRYGNPCEVERMHMKYMPNGNLTTSAMADPGPWVLLSHIYLTLSHEVDVEVNTYDPDIIDSWATFMEVMGCKQFFALSKKRIHLADYRTTKWAESATSWPFATNSADIVDYECLGLEASIKKLLEKEEAHRGTVIGASCISCLRCIIEQLDADWHSRGFDHAKRATFVGTSEAAQRHSLPSSVTLMLQGLKWLPTSHGYLSEGKDLLLESSATAMLRGTVPVLSLELSNKAFVGTMGIRTEVLNTDIMTALSSWSVEAEHVPFSALLSDMTVIYERLASGTPDPSLFASKPLIAIPKEINIGLGKQSFGEFSFFTTTELSWNDPALEQTDGDVPSQVIDVFIPHLSHVYPSCQDFFTSELGVRMSPTPVQQIDFLLKKSGKSSIAHYAMKIFAMWGDNLDKEGYGMTQAQQKLKSAKLFLTHGRPNELLSADDVLHINDLPDQLTLVQTLSDVNVVLLCGDSTSISNIKNTLFRIFSIKPLSVASTITVTPIQVDWPTTKQLWASLNGSLPYAQRYIKSKIPSLWNDQLQGDAVAKKISQTTLRVVTDMTCKVKVLSKEIKTGASIIYSQSILYLKATFAKEFSRVIGELLKGIIKEMGHSFNTSQEEWAQLLDFCHRVVLQMATDPRGVEVYAAEKDIFPIAAAVQKWYLGPLPVINETTEMFPKSAPNPTTAKADRASSITREEVQAFDNKHVSTESDVADKRSGEPSTEEEPVKRAKVDEVEDQQQHTSAESLQAPKTSPDDEQAEPVEKKKSIDRKFLPQDNSQQSAMSVAPPDSVAADLRPYVRILRLWMRQGKAQFVAVPRDSTAQKLGIQFHPQTLSIKKHRPDTPAAAMANDLPVGFHVLACSGIPVRTVPQLAVELEKSQLCKLIVGCEGFPENPTSYLSEHEEAPVHAGGTLSGGSMMRRRIREGEEGAISSMMGERLSELSSHLDDETNPRKPHGDLLSGKSGKGKGGGKSFKGGKRRTPTAEEIQTKGSPLYNGNGSLLGFLSSGGQFESVGAKSGTDQLDATCGLWGEETEAQWSKWNSSLARKKCANCGSTDHLTEDCKLLGDELPLGLSETARERGSKGSHPIFGDKGSGFKGGKGKGGKSGPPGQGDFNPEQDAEGAEFDKVQQTQDELETEQMKVMKLQPYFDPKRDESNQLEAVKKANAQFEEYRQHQQHTTTTSGSQHTGIDSWNSINEARQNAGGRTGDHKSKRAPNLYEPRKNDPGRQESEDDVYQKIGRWGEQFVFRLLRSRATKYQEYAWVNEIEESGASYDIVERVTETTGIVTTTYIEVKATVAAAKMFFDVSHRELQFAQATGPRFHIYRVFGAGSASARLMVIKNPMLELKKGTIGVSGSVKMTLLPLSRQNVKKPMTKVLTFERQSPTDPTGLNVRADMVINKHVGDVNVKASDIAPSGWKIQSINGIETKTISDLKSVLSRGELSLTIVIQSPTDDLC